MNTLKDPDKSTAESGFGGTGTGATIQYDYNNTFTCEKNNYSARPPSFNGDFAQFSWWKSKMYNLIIKD